eukprot:149380_1
MCHKLCFCAYLLIVTVLSQTLFIELTTCGSICSFQNGTYASHHQCSFQTSKLITFPHMCCYTRVLFQQNITQQSPICYRTYTFENTLITESNINQSLHISSWIINGNASIIFNNVTFTNNAATYSFDGINVSFTNCRFENNIVSDISSNSTNAMFIATNSANMTFTNCLFQGNTMFNGSLLILSDTSSRLLLQGCEFFNNNGSLSSDIIQISGIQDMQSTNIVEISDTIFEGNNNFHSLISVQKSIDDHVNNIVDIIRVEMYNNLNNYDIYCDGHVDLTISGSSFQNNSKQTSSIYVADAQDCLIRDSNWTGTQTLNVIHINSNQDCIVTLDDIVMKNIIGRGVFINASYAFINVKNSYFSDIYSSDSGGCMRLHTEKICIIENTFMYLCETYLNGGAVLFDGVPEVSIDSCSFKQCSGAFGGAVVFIPHPLLDTYIDITNSEFTENYANIGSAMLLSQNKPYIVMQPEYVNVMKNQSVVHLQFDPSNIVTTESSLFVGIVPKNKLGMGWADEYQWNNDEIQLLNELNESNAEIDNSQYRSSLFIPLKLQNNDIWNVSNINGQYWTIKLNFSNFWYSLRNPYNLYFDIILFTFAPHNTPNNHVYRNTSFSMDIYQSVFEENRASLHSAIYLSADFHLTFNVSMYHVNLLSNLAGNLASFTVEVNNNNSSSCIYDEYSKHVQIVNFVCQDTLSYTSGGCLNILGNVILTCYNCSISDNRIWNRGAAIYINGGYLRLFASHILRNWSVYGGGNVYVDNTMVDIYACLFVENMAYKYGPSGIFINNIHKLIINNVNNSCSNLININYCAFAHHYGHFALGSIYIHITSHTVVTMAANKNAVMDFNKYKFSSQDFVVFAYSSLTAEKISMGISFPNLSLLDFMNVYINTCQFSNEEALAFLDDKDTTFLITIDTFWTDIDTICVEVNDGSNIIIVDWKQRTGDDNGKHFTANKTSFIATANGSGCESYAKNVRTFIGTQSRGTYCIAIWKTGNSDGVYNLKLKELFKWITPLVTIDHSWFLNCTHEFADKSGAITITTEQNVLEFVSILINNTEFIGNDQGDIYRRFSASNLTNTFDNEFNLMSTLELENVLVIMEGGMGHYSITAELLTTGDEQTIFQHAFSIKNATLMSHTDLIASVIYAYKTNIYVEQSIISNGSGYTEGGCILSVDSSITLYDTMLVKCYAPEGAGLHSSLIQSHQLYDKCVAVYYSDFIDNYAAEDGSAMYLSILGNHSRESCVKLLHNNFRNNTSRMYDEQAEHSVYLDVSSGYHYLFDQSNIFGRHRLCKEQTCKDVRSTLTRMCVSLNPSAICIENGATINISDSSATIYIFGWDAFENLLYAGDSLYTGDYHISIFMQYASTESITGNPAENREYYWMPLSVNKNETTAMVTIVDVNDVAPTVSFKLNVVKLQLFIHTIHNRKQTPLILLLMAIICCILIECFVTLFIGIIVKYL